MSEPKWTLGRRGNDTWDRCICDGPHILAIVNGGGYPISEGWSPESERIAKLLVAAPEIYEALSWFAELTDEGFNAEGRDALTRARAALAKARGETP
jgi:hypothetical protein